MSEDMSYCLNDYLFMFDTFEILKLYVNMREAIISICRWILLGTQFYLKASDGDIQGSTEYS